MTTDDIFTLMFQLRSEAYSLWTLVFGLNTAIIGWILSKNIRFHRKNGYLFLLAYGVMVLLIIVAFRKTYAELQALVHELAYLTRSESIKYAPDGIVARFKDYDYQTHFFYAVVLNAVLSAIVVISILFRPKPDSLKREERCDEDSEPKTRCE